jgi:hypothetical protein
VRRGHYCTTHYDCTLSSGISSTSPKITNIPRPVSDGPSEKEAAVHHSPRSPPATVNHRPNTTRLQVLLSPRSTAKAGTVAQSTVVGARARPPRAPTLRPATPVPVPGSRCFAHDPVMSCQQRMRPAMRLWMMMGRPTEVCTYGQRRAVSESVFICDFRCGEPRKRLWLDAMSESRYWVSISRTYICEYLQYIPMHIQPPVRPYRSIPLHHKQYPVPLSQPLSTADPVSPSLPVAISIQATPLFNRATSSFNGPVQPQRAKSTLAIPSLPAARLPLPLPSGRRTLAGGSQ